MLKKLLLGLLFVALIGGSASLVALAGDGHTLRWLRWQLAQRNRHPVPPEILAMPLPQPPPPEPPLPHHYPIRPRFTGPCHDDPELFTYITERKEALREAIIAQGASDQTMATVNFKRPLGQAEIDRLMSLYGLRLFYIEYVTNTDITGDCGDCNLGEVEAYLRSQYGDLIEVEGAVSVHAGGTLGDLQRLSEDPKVLLVDLAGIEEFAPGKYRYNLPLQIFWRYERACH